MPLQPPSHMDAIERIDFMLKDISAKPLQAAIKGKNERIKTRKLDQNAQIIQAAFKGNENRQLLAHYNAMGEQKRQNNKVHEAPNQPELREDPFVKDNNSTQLKSPQPSVPMPSHSLSPSRTRRIRMELQAIRPCSIEASAEFTELDERKLARPQVDARTVARRRALSIVKLSAARHLSQLKAHEALDQIEAATTRIQGLVRGACVRRRLKELVNSVGLAERQQRAARVIQGAILGSDARLITQGLHLIKEDRASAAKVINAAVRGRAARGGAQQLIVELSSATSPEIRKAETSPEYLVQEAENIYRELAASSTVTKELLIAVHGDENASGLFDGLQDVDGGVTEYHWLCWVSRSHARRGMGGYKFVTELLKALRAGTDRLSMAAVVRNF